MNVVAIFSFPQKRAKRENGVLLKSIFKRKFLKRFPFVLNVLVLVSKLDITLKLESREETPSPPVMTPVPHHPNRTTVSIRAQNSYW